MFDDNQEPKDMFADVPDKAPQPVPPAPLAPAAPAAAAPMPQISHSAPAPVQYDMPKSGGAGLRLVAIMLISLVCICGAGYVAYRFMVRDAITQQVSDVIGGTDTTTTTDDTATTTSTTTADGKGSDNSDTTSSGDNNVDTGPVAVVDSDGDGLSNDEEREAGTSVAKPDTDSDGLGDREEVKVYDTNPKKADTDGDGYTDGEEVQNGYNPNGEGKLLELPQ